MRFEHHGRVGTPLLRELVQGGGDPLPLLVLVDIDPGPMHTELGADNMVHVGHVPGFSSIQKVHQGLSKHVITRRG